MEPHVFPPLLSRHLGDPAAVLELMVEAAAEATAVTGVGIGLLVSADRSRGPDGALRWARLAGGWAGRGVATFGLAGDENRFPSGAFSSAFATARQAGLLAAPHAGVVCDVCPTSNVVLGVYETITDHPLRQLLSAGVRVTLNADDPLLVDTTIGEEYERARRKLGLDDAQLAAIAHTSLQASAAPGDLTSSAAAAIEAWLGGEPEQTTRQEKRSDAS